MVTDRTMSSWTALVWSMSLVPLVAAGPSLDRGLSPCAGPDHCHLRVSRTGPFVRIVRVSAGRRSDEASEGRPRAWLGVRLAPLPDALKAHLGRDGIMITNVVVGSPADEAGLARYDVIVEFDGRSIRTFADLQAAVQQVEPGQDVELRIIRQGKEQTLSIRAGRRPEELGDQRFKYEEPSVERDFLRYFGGRLRRGPHGRWEFEPLGRLRDLLPRELDDDDVPQELREQLEALRQRLREEGHTLRETMRELREKLRHWSGHDWSRDWPGPDFWRGLESEDEDAVFDDAHLSLRLELRDDEHIVVEKDEAGWHVEREDPDGKRTTADYDDLEALRKADPRTYRLLRRHLRIGGGFIFRWPELGRLPELQKRFEEEFRESLRRRHGQPDRDTPQRHVRPEHSKRRARAPRDASGRQILVVQREGGRIRVRLLEEGRRPRTYTFRNLDELRRTLPEVYEQARELFETDDD